MTGIPYFFRIDDDPMPDLSKILGEPKAPAEMTTNFVAFAVVTGPPTPSTVYSIPIARFPLSLCFCEFVYCTLCFALLEFDTFDTRLN